MKAATRVRSVLAVVGIAVAGVCGVWAQELPPPAGPWRSPASTTTTNPALTGAELYLSIEVAKDGSFRGVWGQYFCNAYPGAYGISIYSCSRLGSRRASGRFGPGRQGVIELDTLGRSAFTWAAPSADELAIDLPKDWQGKDAVLYRARMTRDGKARPATASAPRDDGPLLSANALYREFKKDEKAALARHAGKTLVLEGRRGNLIALGDGGAAVHVADGFQSRALVLYFRDLKQPSGIGEGAQFRFRCRVWTSPTSTCSWRTVRSCDDHAPPHLQGRHHADRWQFVDEHLAFEIQADEEEEQRHETVVPRRRSWLGR